LGEEPGNNKPRSLELEKAKKYSTQASLALELPFTIVGGVLLGGVLAIFLIIGCTRK